MARPFQLLLALRKWAKVVDCRSSRNTPKSARHHAAVSNGFYQENDLAVADLSSGNLAAGSHSLEIKTLGKPYVDHVAVFAAPQSPPLFRVDGGQLDPWSTNYHVIEVTSDMVPSNEDVLIPNDLTIELGSREWSAEFEPPFHTFC